MPEKPAIFSAQMPKEPHTLASNWREADAAALEERVTACVHWLDHTQDLVDMFETFGKDDDVSTELRTVSGLIRTRRDDISQKAETLRAELADRSSK